MRLRQFVFVMVTVASSVVFRGADAAEFSFGSRENASGAYTQHQSIQANHPAKVFTRNCSAIVSIPFSTVRLISQSSGQVLGNFWRAVLPQRSGGALGVPITRGMVLRVVWVGFLFLVVITATSARRDFY